MSQRLSAFFNSLRHDPKLARWALILASAHLLIFSALAVAGRAEDLVISQDAHEYLKLASYPVTDGIYTLDGVTPSGKREPGYSGFIMAFMATRLVQPHVFSVANLWPVIVLQILLYGLACYHVARVAAGLFGNLSGWVCLLLIQATPICVYQHMIRNECLTTILLAALWVAFATRWKNGPEWTTILTSALWLGLLGITKSVNVLFIPVLSLLAWIRLPVRLPKVAVFCFLSLLPALAWTARNKAEFGLPIMGSIDGFSSLYRGNILPYEQIPSPDNPAMPEVAQQALKQCKNDGEKYLWYKQAALAWLKENPVQYLKQCVHRTAAMFIDLYRKDEIPWWQYPFLLVVGNDQLFLTLLLLVCLVPLLRRQEFWIESSLLFFLFSIAIYGAVYGEERYLHPMFFLLAPLHAWCLVEWFWPWLRNRLR